MQDKTNFEAKTSDIKGVDREDLKRQLENYHRPSELRDIENEGVCSCGEPKSPKALACRKCRPAIDLYIHHLKRWWNLKPEGKAQLIEGFKKRGFGPVGICCFCGERYILGGNNPAPIIKDHSENCCVRCRDEIVLPARMAVMRLEEKKHRI